ncbi:MAG: hypothetical protein OXJ52_00845 [Oligoflexia bacterium]|nr:hypothetical protein [Oligoflexia bacterium]
MIFRLLDFALRVVGSFFFVFLLQFQFDGRALESYLNDFGKKFVVTKTLKKVSQDGSKVIRSFLKEESAEEKKQKREIASQKSEQAFDSFLKRISKPSNEAKDSKE